jgi:hypothetical protein
MTKTVKAPARPKSLALEITAIEIKRGVTLP